MFFFFWWTKIIMYSHIYILSFRIEKLQHFFLFFFFCASIWLDESSSIFLYFWALAPILELVVYPPEARSRSIVAFFFFSRCYFMALLGVIYINTSEIIWYLVVFYYIFTPFFFCVSQSMSVILRTLKLLALLNLLLCL